MACILRIKRADIIKNMGKTGHFPPKIIIFIKKQRKLSIWHDDCYNKKQSAMVHEKRNMDTNCLPQT